ncbi:MAG TPA: HAD family phosphatase [Gammaproteobacteria bacterium]|nr:HAD family phosphatase [Gammaproteobacteria bacterium]
MAALLNAAKRIEAVIFDMDGLLVDTETLAMRALMSAAANMDLDLPEKLCHLMIGVPAEHSRYMLQNHFGYDFCVESFLEIVDLHMTGAINAGCLRLKAGVLQLLACLEDWRMAKAVATSSSRNKAMRHLGATQISDRFDAIITRDDVERGKPHPDLFLRTADELGFPPGRCLVLEDSYNGVRAAHGAGTKVVMVPDILPPTDEMRSKCVMIAANLHAVPSILSNR